MDSVPYKTEYVLIEHLDSEWHGNYHLSREQFNQIVNENFNMAIKMQRRRRPQTACH